jgi:hypothetical protein
MSRKQFREMQLKKIARSWPMRTSEFRERIARICGVSPNQYVPRPTGPCIRTPEDRGYNPEEQNK